MRRVSFELRFQGPHQVSAAEPQMSVPWLAPLAMYVTNLAEAYRSLIDAHRSPHRMLALSPFALSYAPAFVARPVAVRSSVHMNHGMPPVYYDHDQEVHTHPLLHMHPHTQSNSNPVVLPR